MRVFERAIVVIRGEKGNYNAPSLFSHSISIVVIWGENALLTGNRPFHAGILIIRH